MDKKFGPQVELEPAALKSQKSDEILSKALPLSYTNKSSENDKNMLHKFQVTSFAY